MNDRPELSSEPQKKRRPLRFVLKWFTICILVIILAISIIIGYGFYRINMFSERIMGKTEKLVDKVVNEGVEIIDKGSEEVQEIMDKGGEEIQEIMDKGGEEAEEIIDKGGEEAKEIMDKGVEKITE